MNELISSDELRKGEGYSKQSDTPKIELFKPLVPTLHPLHSTQVLSLPSLVVDQKRTLKEKLFSRPWHPFKRFKKVPDLNIYRLDNLIGSVTMFICAASNVSRAFEILKARLPEESESTYSEHYKRERSPHYMDNGWRDNKQYWFPKWSKRAVGNCEILDLPDPRNFVTGGLEGHFHYKDVTVFKGPGIACSTFVYKGIKEADAEFRLEIAKREKKNQLNNAIKCANDALSKIARLLGADEIATVKRGSGEEVIFECGKETFKAKKAPEPNRMLVALAELCGEFKIDDLKSVTFEKKNPKKEDDRFYKVSLDSESINIATEEIRTENDTIIEKIVEKILEKEDESEKENEEK